MASSYINFSISNWVTYFLFEINLFIFQNPYKFLKFLNKKKLKLLKIYRELNPCKFFWRFWKTVLEEEKIEAVTSV